MTNVPIRVLQTAPNGGQGLGAATVECEKRRHPVLTGGKLGHEFLGRGVGAKRCCVLEHAVNDRRVSASQLGWAAGPVTRLEGSVRFRFHSSCLANGGTSVALA